MVGCGRVSSSIVKYGMVWCGVVWYSKVWYGVVWCGMVWCGVMWCGMVWYGTVRYGHYIMVITLTHLFLPQLLETSPVFFLRNQTGSSVIGASLNSGLRTLCESNVLEKSINLIKYVVHS